MSFRKKRRKTPSPFPSPPNWGRGQEEGEISDVKGHTAFVLITSLIALLMICAGCSTVPETALLPGAPEELHRCVALFPSDPWECVHTIEAVIQGGMSSSLLGITKGDPAGRKLHTVLLTPEGFILFEAEQHGDTISVLKAVAPFDSPALAKGLMEDVSFLFLAPEARPSKWGRTADGAVLCQWESSTGYLEEVSLSMVMKISLVDKHGDLLKEALLTPPFVKGLASQMELRAHKPAFYRLKMTLIQGTP